MRKYTLVSAEKRQRVDLRDYTDIITEAVTAAIPNADVRVERDCYYVSPTPSQGEAIKIGRRICQSDLKHCCVPIPKLFSSIELKEVKENGTEEQERTGGHR